MQAPTLTDYKTKIDRIFFLQKASRKLYLRLVIHRQTGRPQDINLATISAYDLIQQ